jgi:hypothetical protein
MVLNSADFYGPGLGVANLELVSRFFEQYPEYVDRAFLSVKVRRSAWPVVWRDIEGNLERGSQGREVQYGLLVRRAMKVLALGADKGQDG